MPITIKTNLMKYKNPDTQVYQGADMLEETTIRDAVVPAYDSTASYSVDNHVLYNGYMYKCIVAIPTGGEAWNPAHWEQTTVTEELERVEGNQVYYGVCSTAGGTQAKTVTITGITEYTTGLHLRIKFTEAQNYNGTAPTLNVNSLGAKTILSRDGTSAVLHEWIEGSVLDLVYDGTDFVIVDGSHATTSYFGKTQLSSSLTSTSEDLAATPKAVKTVNDKVGDGQLDSGFTATDLTGAANELKGEAILDRAARQKEGAVNLLPYPYSSGSTSEHGITYTVNSDGSVTLSGTATQATALLLSLKDFGSTSFNSRNVSAAIYKAYLLNAPSGFKLTYFQSTKNTIIEVDNGAAVSGSVTVYPMICFAEETVTEYRPYAMTNTDLTGAENELNNAINGVRSDLAKISITGTTNNTGANISSETYVWLNGELVKTIAPLANGETFTENSNYIKFPYGIINAIIIQANISNGNTFSVVAHAVMISRWFNGANKFALYTVDFSSTVNSPINTFGASELTVTYSSGKFNVTNNAGGVVTILAF